MRLEMPALNLAELAKLRAEVPVLYRHWPPELAPISQQPMELQAKALLWEQINEYLVRLGDPNQPPWQPTAEHWRLHLAPALEKMAVGGERGGKSRWCEQEAVAGFAPRGHYWIVGNEYKDTVVEFEAIVVFLQAMGALPQDDGAVGRYVKKPGDRGWTIRPIGPLAGALIETQAIDDPVKISSVALDGVVVCEAGKLISKEVILKLRGRLAQRHGWMVINGTFEKTKSPWLGIMWEEWRTLPDDHYRQCGHFPTGDNVAVYPLGREDPGYLRAIDESDPDRIEERFEGTPISPSTLVFRRFKTSVHVREDVRWLHHVPGTGTVWPVFLAIDPGITNGAVLAIQLGRDAFGEPVVYVVDEVYTHRKSPDEIAAECKQRPWWPCLGDRGHVIDVAGRAQRDKLTDVQHWRRHGVHCFSQMVGIDTGIERLASFLWGMQPDGQGFRPRLFLSPRCRKTIMEFHMYRYPDRLEPEARIKPVDAWNHSMKALGYFLVRHFGPARGAHMAARSVAFDRRATAAEERQIRRDLRRQGRRQPSRYERGVAEIIVGADGVGVV